MDCTDRPAPTIVAGYVPEIVITDEVPRARATGPQKPPYRVPLMAEIREMPWNGFNVISTFAGGGGSSTGYRMAGYRILFASEFVEAARETYRANASPSTILDGRDIRQLTAEDLLFATGLKPGELDILDGSPPCASFSTAGKREKGWGTVKAYSDTQQRSDDLFFEYARLIDGVRPKVFVAENVSGLVKGTAKGYFIEIIRKLKSFGYKVEAQLLDAQWLGVPQARQRLIFVGVRDDLGLSPAFPKPLPFRYSVRDALPWITRAVHDTSGLYGAGEITNRPCPTVTVGVNSVNANHYQVYGEVEPEADISRFAIGEEWDKLGGPGQSDRYFQLVRPDPNAPCPTVTASGGSGSIASVTHPYEKRKFSIAELRRICGFPDDYVLKGDFAQQWERLGRAVPPVMMSHVAATVRDHILAKL